MKFRKVKKPKGIILAGGNIPGLFVNSAGSAEFAFGYKTFGPREAVKIAKWLERYARWSSLK